MLKHNITNVVGMNGTRLPAEIAKLGETKEITLFVDGDRGGKLIATNVCGNAKIAYIAQAPDGKEVEELAGKELHLAIRKRVTPEEFFKKFDRAEEPRRFERSYDNRERFSRYERRDEPTQDAPKTRSEKVLSADDKKKLKDLSSEVRGKNVLVLDEKLNVLRNVPVSKLEYLRLEESVWVLLTSFAANNVIEGAQKLGARYVAAESFGRIDNANGVEIVSI
jgi:DNA primase